MNCERCNNEHDGSYGSGRFCSSKCARGFSTSRLRNEINERVSKKLRGGVRVLDKNGKRTYIFHKIEILEIDLRREVPQAKSWRELSVRLTGRPSIAWRLPREVAKLGLDVSHFLKPRTAEQILCKRPGEPKGRLRDALIKIGRKYECSECRLGPEWEGKKLTLHVDHIDGDNTNHVPENLRFLCPNCHSQTDTFAWKNARRKKKNCPLV